MRTMDFRKVETNNMAKVDHFSIESSLAVAVEVREVEAAEAAEAVSIKMATSNQPPRSATLTA